MDEEIAGQWRCRWLIVSLSTALSQGLYTGSGQFSTGMRPSSTPPVDNGVGPGARWPYGGAFPTSPTRPRTEAGWRVCRSRAVKEWHARVGPEGPVGREGGDGNEPTRA